MRCYVVVTRSAARYGTSKQARGGILSVLTRKSASRGQNLLATIGGPHRVDKSFWPGITRQRRAECELRDAILELVGQAKTCQSQV